MVDSNTFALNTWDVTDYVDSEENNVWFSHGDDEYVSVTNAILIVERGGGVDEDFDTHSPANPYPSIMGIHNGTIRPSHDISVSKMYTYPCSGTGGHTEYLKIWNETTGDCAEAHWDGYVGDYHNISLNRTLTLKEGVIYNYTIRTGSYPQIIREHEYKNATGGTITCTKFVDANGKEHNDWIPAIRLWG